MKMGDFYAGDSNNIFIIVGISVLLCTLLHFFFKIIFKNAEKTHGIEQQSNSLDGDGSEATAEESLARENRPSKSRKRTWKPKSEFSHSWLLKSLKGHPGRVLASDLASNGKYMAATCDGHLGPPKTGASSRAGGARASLYRSFVTSLLPLSPPSPTYIMDELRAALEPYLLTPERMWAMGYPMELEPNSTKAVIYIHPPPRKAVTTLDVNAPEFIPGMSNGDSGRGSWGSTPRSDSDEEGSDAIEHTCVRCDKPFRITRDGEYVEADEPCVHHWGRLDGGRSGRYGCCGGGAGSRGCSAARFHVWTGTRAGMNGPLDGFVRARALRGGVFALDAEMCYTTAGLEVGSVAVVGVDGRTVYRAAVRPGAPVVDCNTRFSGLRARDVARATKSLRDVQNDILGFVGADTVLVGHALDNDLRALKLLHGAVVDTCALYPHARGLPLRRSLRALAAEHLGRRVQSAPAPHDPLEDARAAMDLVLHKLLQDSRARAARTALEPYLIEPYDPLLTCA